MTKKVKYITGIILVMVMVMVLIFTTTALAIEPGIYLVEGNPSCATLNADPFFDNINSDFGFKIEGDYNRTVSMDGTAAGTTLTGGAPADSSNTVTVSSEDGVYFDWSSTLGMDAVIVKGGTDGNVYVYVPEVYGDTGLHSPINDNNGQPFAISHIEFCYDYELLAEKTANAEFTRTYTWEITKDFDGTYDGFIGDAVFFHDYEVTVDRTVTDSDYAVSGTITVENPTPFEVGFSISDSVDGVPAEVTCSTGTLAAGASTTCSYSADLASALDGTNVATITSTNLDVGGATASADYAFGDPTTVVGEPTVNVSDDKYGTLGQASDDTTFKYTGSFQCSADPADYTDGVAEQIKVVNTATIVETEQFDDATVTLDCYIWDVSKTAGGSYQNKYGWDITKTVDPESQSGFPGDTLDWTWTVSWNSYFIEEVNHAVSGVITVNNPNPSDELTVNVTDELTGGFAATVTCNDADGGTALTIAAGGSGTCNYTAAPSSQLAQNTATASRNSVSVSDIVTVNWVPGDDIGLDATISDTNNVDIPVGGTNPFIYTDSVDCSNDLSLYVDDGKSYSGSASNTATITWTGGSESDGDSTSYTC
jgi:hypothetical protein